MTSQESESTSNPNANHIEEFHRSPCENNPSSSTNSEQSESECSRSPGNNHGSASNSPEPAPTTTTTAIIKKHDDGNSKAISSSVERRKSLVSHKDGFKAANKLKSGPINKKLSYDDDDDDDDDYDDDDDDEAHNDARGAVREDGRQQDAKAHDHSDPEANELSPLDSELRKEKGQKRVLNHDDDDDDRASKGSRDNGNSKGAKKILLSSDVKTSTAKCIESDRDDEDDEVDASSTSSCSCEDHSSVNGDSSLNNINKSNNINDNKMNDNNNNSKSKSTESNPQFVDDIHMEDLDYNEDSMSDNDGEDDDDSSSDEPREYNRLASERRMPTTTATSSHNTSTTLNNNHSHHHRHHLNNNQSSHHGNNKHKQLNHRTSSPDVKRESETKKQPASTIASSSRIKSFINVSHHGQGDANSHQQQNESSNGNESREKILSNLIASKSRKSYESLLRYFSKDACYFQVKSINHENVELSKSMGVWSTSIQNEIRFNAAFRAHRNVILIFSVQQSGAFQGFARMISESKQTSRPIPWILPERLSNKSLSGVFKVEWLSLKELPFHETHELYNPFNGNKPVKVARDGQQVASKVGKKLCKLFPHKDEDKARLLNAIVTLKYQTSQRKKSNHKQDNFYPLIDGRSNASANNHNNDKYRGARQPGPRYMPQPYLAAGMNGFGPGVHPGHHQCQALGFPQAPHHLDYINPYYSYAGHMNYISDQAGDEFYHSQGPRGRTNYGNSYNSRSNPYTAPIPQHSGHQNHMSPDDESFYHHNHHQNQSLNLASSTNPHLNNLPLAYENVASVSKSSSSGFEANHRYHAYRKHRR